MQREMEVLDVMTANRDKRIWAVAQGKDLQGRRLATRRRSSRSKTNKPGTGPNGKHLFLDGEEAIEKMTVAKGLKVNLFASEKEFPELAKPVQMAFDTKGRLWVAVWPTYPHWKPKEAMNDKLLILEDTDGDGKADKMTVFADSLHCPTGFEFYNGGVLVAQAPDLMFLKDTDGDDKADVRERVLSGLDSADTHHTANSFRARPRRGPLLPGGDVPPHAGRDAVRPAGPAAPTPASSATSRGRRSSRSTSPTASPTRTATSSTAGARTSSIDGTGANPYHATAVLRPPRLSRQARPRRRRSTSSGPGRAPASRSSPAGTSPSDCRATCWSPT